MSVTFQCGACGGTFEKGRSDAEARAEQALNGWSALDCVVICEDCYREFMVWQRAIPLLEDLREDLRWEAARAEVYASAHTRIVVRFDDDDPVLVSALCGVAFEIFDSLFGGLIRVRVARPVDRIARRPRAWSSHDPICIEEFARRSVAP